MTEKFKLGEIVIAVKRTEVKHVYLSVHPPAGRVTLVAPKETRLDVARAYAVSRLAWIREQREALQSQSRETQPQLVERESHYLWGRRYLLSVIERDAKPAVTLGHRRITLAVRPGTHVTERAAIMHEWHLSLMHEVVPNFIRRWERKLDVHVSDYFFQRMKTKWGSCNHANGTIRLNTELVKKPKDLLEYVIVHELLHLHEPTHSERFMLLLTQHYPKWREARAELNELPLAAEVWAGITRK
jgi:predicted metal-dependent hydrolase